ncbi:MAG: hypothetical protein ACLPN5_23305 [Roseiarcus sp.]
MREVATHRQPDRGDADRQSAAEKHHLPPPMAQREPLQQARPGPAEVDAEGARHVRSNPEAREK